MGYTTRFTGSIEVTPKLNPQEIEFLNKFNGTRRMDRKNGPYFVDGTGFAGQGHDADILNHNQPPEGQPGLWCQWIPKKNGKAIKWDGWEKFYDSCEWMEYLIEHFIGEHPIAKKLYPEQFAFLQGHTLNRTIKAKGEDKTVHWCMHVVENVVSKVNQ